MLKTARDPKSFQFSLMELT